MKALLVLVIGALLLSLAKGQIQMVELPLVSPRTQRMVTFQINYLKLMLPTYNWLFCNKYMLWKVAVQVSEVLHTAAQEMKRERGNMVDGEGNTVAGFGNVVIGSGNGLVGLNNWCFTSDYETDVGTYDEGILALGNYKLELSRVDLIRRDPKLAISTIDESELEALKKKNVAIAFFFR